MTYYAVIALVEVPDELTHEAVYDLVDIEGALYVDVEPNWRTVEVLEQNAAVDVPQIGSYVKDHYGNRGRVYKIHRGGCPETKEWRDGQSHPLEGIYAEGKGTWYSVLVHPAGAVVVPENKLEIIPRFDFENPYAEHEGLVREP